MSGFGDGGLSSTHSSRVTYLRVVGAHGPRAPLRTPGVALVGIGVGIVLHLVIPGLHVEPGRAIPAGTEQLVTFRPPHTQQRRPQPPVTPPPRGRTGGGAPSGTIAPNPAQHLLKMLTTQISQGLPWTSLESSWVLGVSLGWATCHLCAQETFTWAPVVIFMLRILYLFSCTFGKIYAAHEPHISQISLLKTKLDLRHLKSVEKKRSSN